MSGTGLKKCMPTTRSGRFVAAPRSAIGIDEVFDARTTSGRVISSSCRKIARLISGSSVAASITRSTSARSRTSVVPEIRAEDLLALARIELAPLHGAERRRLDPPTARVDELVG